MVFPEKMKYLILKIRKFSHKMRMRVFHLKPKSISSHSHDTIKERTEGSKKNQHYRNKPDIVIPSVQDEITWDLHLKPYKIRTLLLWCSKDRNNERRAAMLRKWKHLIAGKLEIREMPGSHSTIINAPQVAETAKETLKFINIYSKPRKHE
jgi:thioesterase domain-containing protein